MTGSGAALRPEPMPLELKVVLIGDRLTYYLLGGTIPEFAALFRINADMESEIERSATTPPLTPACSPPWRAAPACRPCRRRRWRA